MLSRDRYKHKADKDEFVTVPLTPTTTKRTLQKQPPARVSHVFQTIILLVLTLTLIAMFNITPPRILSALQTTPASLGGAIKVDKAGLVERLKNLVDETQQDVIVDQFSPYKRIGSSRSMLNAITCVTQGGVSKIPRLLDLTSRWRGPVSFATLISSESDLDLLFKFWAENPLLQEYVSIHILMELPQTQRHQNGRFPINELRNLALHNVKTDYVFLNDVDFIPSEHAHDEIAALIKASPPSTKTFWVLPAFERLAPKSDNTNVTNEVTDVAMIPKTKAELMHAINVDKTVTSFHAYFKPGHGPTDFEKWYTFNDTTSSTTMMYPIEYAKWYEPYVVCKTQDLHQYFPMFRGFGYNKNSFFVEANVRNYTYQVLTQQFIVHMNHKGREDRFTQDNNHLEPMLAGFFKHLKDTYDVPDVWEEHYR